MIKVNVNKKENIEQIEVDINCKEINSEVLTIVKKIEDLDKKDTIKAYKGKLLSILNISEIVRIYAEDRSVFLETVKDKYVIKDTLKVLEEELNIHFIRISNSEIINVKKIKNLDLSFSGTIRINFQNGNFTYVSRRYVKKIKERLEV